MAIKSKTAIKDINVRFDALAKINDGMATVAIANLSGVVDDFYTELLRLHKDNTSINGNMLAMALISALDKAKSELQASIRYEH